jgi:hypothetical protein
MIQSRIAFNTTAILAVSVKNSSNSALQYVQLVVSLLESSCNESLKEVVSAAVSC